MKKCKHNWEYLEPLIYGWCKRCGTLRYLVNNNYKYIYPKNRKEAQ